MKKLTINIVLGHELPFPQLEGGGVNSLIMQIINGFDKTKVDIAVYSPLSGTLKYMEVIDGVKHIRVRGSKRRKNTLFNIIVGFPYAFRVMLKMRRADILFSHFWHGFIFTFSSKTRFKTHTVHRDPNRALRFFGGFDKVFFGSDSVAEDAKILLPSMKNKFLRVYNCVDYLGYEGSKKRPKDAYVKFLYIGRFSEDKGLESFLNGFDMAYATNKSIRFKTIGPLDYKGGSNEKFLKRIKQYVRDKNLNDVVSITGPIYNRKDLDIEIFNADVIVLPSIYGETLNMVALESMRIGRPILVSDLQANVPLIEEGVTGIFCERNNSRSWSKGILHYAELIDKDEFVGQRVFDYGQGKFSSTIISEEYLGIFQKMLTRGQ